jgi:glutathione S-transferase
MKLYSHPVSPNARKARLTAAHLGIALEEQMVDLRNGEQRTPAFLAKNPNGKVPVLEDDGFLLWESNAICQYLCAQVPGNSLFPNDARARADIDRWQSWELAHLSPASAKVLYQKFIKQLLGLGAPDAAIVAEGEQEFARFGAVLNAALEGRRFLVGDSPTLADFTIAPMIALGRTVGLEPGRHVLAWLDRIAELDAWKRTEPPQR